MGVVMEEEGLPFFIAVLVAAAVLVPVIVGAAITAVMLLLALA